MPWSDDDERGLREAEFAQRNLDAETLEDIRRFRRDAGLPADDATVSWFLAEYQAGRQDPGLWETAAESRAAQARQALIDDGLPLVSAYLDRNADAFGRWEYSWCHGVPTQVISFQSDVDSHRSALIGLHPHPEVIEVVQRREKKRRSAAERAQGRAQAKRARQIPKPPVPVLWQLWSIDQTGTQLTVHYRTDEANGPPDAHYEEDDQSVRVTIVERLPQHGSKLMGETRHATIELREPLAGRAVIDGCGGEARPRSRSQSR
jgi:hypothetical protein